jgi:hypothetical protein
MAVAGEIAKKNMARRFLKMPSESSSIPNSPFFNNERPVAAKAP